MMIYQTAYNFLFIYIFGRHYIVYLFSIELHAHFFNLKDARDSRESVQQCVNFSTYSTCQSSIL